MSLKESADGRGIQEEDEQPLTAGGKFYHDGRVRPFRGNTVVSHLAQQGPDADCFNALLDIYREFPKHTFARKFSLLPPSSYHITIFDCTVDGRRQRMRWPTGVALDVSMDQCDAILKDRLRAQVISEPMPICMRVKSVQDAYEKHGFGIHVVPADEQEGLKLRQIRRQIATATGLSLPEPDSHIFHITIAYKIQSMTDDEQSAFAQKLSEWAQMIEKISPLIRLDTPEFCTFKDMYAYNRQMFL